MKIEKLTKEQEQKALEIKEFWLDYIFSCQNSINKESAKIGIDWMYKLSGKNEPVVIYVDSPLACQYTVSLLKELKIKRDSVWASVGDSVWASVGDSVRASVRDSVGDSVRASVRDSVRASVGDSVGDSVWASVGDSVRASVWASVWASVGDSVRASVWASVGASVRASVGASVGASVWASVGDSVRASVWESFSWYGNIGDYGWVSFYDFFTNIGVINNEGFNKFKNLLLSGVYDMIQLDGYCIVSNLPSVINRNFRGQLHSEDSAAIEFRDGYKLWYWNGVNVGQKLIETPELISKEDILSQENAEVRRCYREKLGSSVYYDLLGGAELIDEDTDNQGNIMKLFITKTIDPIVNRKVQFIEVKDPSTDRVYNLYPPNQNSKNVWEAKASTFGKKESDFKPLIET